MPEPPLPRRSEFLWGWFLWYLRGMLRKSFHGVRLARGGPTPADLTGPLVVYLNHPSWWDPLVAALLTTRFPGRVAYAPFDAAALPRYPFFDRFGFFAVEQGTARGGMEFLRIGQKLLEEPRNMLWVTAQGRFADARERPVVLKPGVAHLARRLKTGLFVPLALEYPFWEERTPEALARFGPPLAVADHPDWDAERWLAELTARLTGTQDALREDALSRDAGRFETLGGGSVGVGGLYDWWRRLTSWLRGRRFDPAHGRENAR